MKKTISALGATLLLCLASQASASLITPVSVSASSEFAPAINLINGSGLDTFGLHDNNENNMWQTFNLNSGTSIGETVEFVLDQNYDLSEAVIWQYNGLNGFGLPEPDRELDEVAIAVSSSLGGAFNPIGTINLAPAFDQTSSAGEPAQLFDISGANNVRRVQFTINSVQGGIDDGTAGLSEVRFNGTPTIPEPNPAAGLLLGLAAVGYWLRR
ncbi:MAG: hypothetical protein AAGF97_07705 [Planctomycetota bacterium]